MAEKFGLDKMWNVFPRGVQCPATTDNGPQEYINRVVGWQNEELSLSSFLLTPTAEALLLMKTYHLGESRRRRQNALMYHLSQSRTANTHPRFDFYTRFRSSLNCLLYFTLYFIRWKCKMVRWFCEDETLSNSSVSTLPINYSKF